MNDNTPAVETDDDRLRWSACTLDAYARDIERYGQPLNTGCPSDLRFAARMLRERLGAR